MTELGLFSGIAYFLLYMYFSANLLMLVLEKKVKFVLSKPKNSFQNLLDLTSKELNPNDYIAARIHLWGTVVTLLGGVVVLYYMPHIKV